MKEETIASIEQLKRSFGRGGRQRVKLTDAESEDQRRAQLRKLLASDDKKSQLFPILYV